MTWRDFSWFVLGCVAALIAGLVLTGDDLAALAFAVLWVALLVLTVRYA